MSNQETIQVIEEFSRRIIALNPIYIDISGSATAGILLSQILYWDGVKKKSGDSEFFKTYAEFREETRLTLHELRTAKKKLTDIGLISIVRKGIPAKSYYEVDHAVLCSLITSYAESVQLVTRNPYNRSCGIRTTNIDKTTTEITTDINIYNGRDAREKKRRPKISLDELSVEHIREWLADKRITGSYMNCDEHLVLEKFKNYCLSKGKKYEDYVAAYRNAFEWDSNKSTGNSKQGKRASKSDDYDSALEEGLVGTVSGQGGLRDLLS